MSNISFRTKALDATKPMPIYKSEELPDLSDYSAINRAVPQIPSGIKKAEECEHHLQRAICTGLIIPTPEVAELADEETYKRIYPEDYKLPRQLIHIQPLEQDIPDYDMDSEDEIWVNTQARKMDLTPLKFEEMMDRLEKGSGQTLVTLQEAKSLLKEDDDLIIAVYDYWFNKRLTTQHPLIPAVKTEHRHGSAVNNPYVAFLRRPEQMQTRKNRKNDESSYEKMLKFRRDLTRAVTLLELVKRREKTKLEYLHLTIEVYEKRYEANDFSGQMLAELSALKTPRPAFAPLFTNDQNWSYKVVTKDEAVPRKEKRQYLKRKEKATGPSSATGTSAHGMGSRGSTSTVVETLGYGYGWSSDEDTETLTNATGQSEEEPEPSEGPFAKEKLQYKKRKQKATGPSSATGTSAHGMGSRGSTSTVVETLGYGYGCSSEEDTETLTNATGQSDEEPEPSEGPFAFRRNKHCSYHAPLSGLTTGNWPWTSREDGGLADRRYHLTSISKPKRKCIGFSRRRVGRGGRIILDRASTSIDDVFSSLDFTIHDSNETKESQSTPLDGSSEGLLHFRPKSPIPLTSTSSDGEEIEPHPRPSGMTEDPILSALDGTPLNMDIECVSQDIFKLDGGLESYATQLDLNENSKSHYGFPYDENSVLLPKTSSDDDDYHFGCSGIQIKRSRYSTQVHKE